MPARGNAIQSAHGCGTAFKLTPPATGRSAWTESVLYRFAGETNCATDGAIPAGGLLADAQGALYGVTEAGGRGCRPPAPPVTEPGCGTVFRLTPPANGRAGWAETVLYRFLGGIDGATPVGGLIAGPHGLLFGATAAGGIPFVDCGTIFMLTPPTAGETAWTKKVLHRFAGTPDACIPMAGLIADGVLHGTTYGGGRSGYGAVFELTPPTGGRTAWTERVLYSFKFGTDGALPQAGLVAVAHGAREKGTGFARPPLVAHQPRIARRGAQFPRFRLPLPCPVGNL